MAEKPGGKRSWKMGFAGERLYAGFPHLELSGESGLAERFVRAARDFKGVLD